MNGSSRVIPIILSGGSGTRLWPLSRSSKPKQFLKFGTEHSLFQETVLRCRSGLFDTRPIVVGAEAHRFLLATDLNAIGVEADILLEPFARNTCAAIAVACRQALARDSHAIVLVLAADHFIPDVDAFTRAVSIATGEARLGHLVTFGVTPQGAATGYGYIAPGATRGGDCLGVKSFIEKLDAASAARYVEEGYLWNSGNFLFEAGAFLSELAALSPDIHAATGAAFDDISLDMQFTRLGRFAYAQLPAFSVDNAVMEKTGRAVVLPVDYQWSDVGSWDAVTAICKADGEGNTVTGDGLILEGRNNLVHSTHQLVTVVGLDNVSVVATKDSVLIARRGHGEDVRSLVAMLETQGRKQTNEAPRMFRPWGDYEQLDVGDGYQVKRLTVKPGGVLSLQRHQHRSEHWVVVSGEVEATIGDKVCRVAPNESVHVPAGTIHRLANHGFGPAVLIEVQTGSYLGEDDITRFADIYNRPASDLEQPLERHAGHDAAARPRVSGVRNTGSNDPRG